MASKMWISGMPNEFAALQQSVTNITCGLSFQHRHHNCAIRVCSTITTMGFEFSAPAAFCHNSIMQFDAVSHSSGKSIHSCHVHVMCPEGGREGGWRRLHHWLCTATDMSTSETTSNLSVTVMQHQMNVKTQIPSLEDSSDAFPTTTLFSRAEQSRA